MARAWLTPDTLPDTKLCRVIRIPDDIALVAAVSGALLELTRQENWEQYGQQTPAATASVMQSMFYDYLSSTGDACVSLDIAHAVHDEAQGVNGGSNSGSGVADRVPFNLFRYHPSWIGLSSNVFQIQAGLYQFSMWHFYQKTSGLAFAWLQNEAGYPTMVIDGLHVQAVNDRQLHVSGVFDVAGEFHFGFWAQCNGASVPNTGFGQPKNLAGWRETYGLVSFLRLGDSRQ